MDDLTRVFYVVDSTEDNEEIFETLEGAQAHMLSAMSEPQTARLYVAKVRNAYRDPTNDDQWAYEDLSDTFEIVQTLEANI